MADIALGVFQMPARLLVRASFQLCFQSSVGKIELVYFGELTLQRRSSSQ